MVRSISFYKKLGLCEAYINCYSELVMFKAKDNVGLWQAGKFFYLSSQPSEHWSGTLIAQAFWMVQNDALSFELTNKGRFDLGMSLIQITAGV